MHTAPDLTFDSLVKRYRRPLTAAAYHLCGDAQAAQDIVQETFTAAFAGLDGLREPDKAGPWLYAILRRKAAAYRRARRPEMELLAEPTMPGPEGSESLVRDIIVEHIAKLPDEDREILAGKYLLGLSYKELSESLGIKEGAVRVRCFRAKEKLRAILSGAGVDVNGQMRGPGSDGHENSFGGDTRGM